MATVKGIVEANKLSNPMLISGIMETVIDREHLFSTAKLATKAWEGTLYEYVLEDGLPTVTTQIDPHTSGNLNEATSTRNRESVPIRAQAINADTSKVSLIGKSDHFNQRAVDIMAAGKKIGRDWLDGKFLGTGQDNAYYGFPYWIERMTTLGYTGHDIDFSGADLSTVALMNILNSSKTGGYDVLFCAKPVYTAIEEILNDMPGNRAIDMMDKDFGQSVLSFKGTPIVMSDALLRDKVISAGNATISTNTLTLSSVDNGFPGFSRDDIGKTVGDESAGSTTISAYTSPSEVTLADGTQLDDSEELTIAGNTTGADGPNVIYGVRYGEHDGFAWVYYENPGDSVDQGKYQGSIVGFSTEDLKTLESTVAYRTRLDVFGNFALHDPDALVRFHNFDLP